MGKNLKIKIKNNNSGLTHKRSKIKKLYIELVIDFYPNA
jgi:hypothetical protein